MRVAQRHDDAVLTASVNDAAELAHTQVYFWSRAHLPSSAAKCWAKTEQTLRRPRRPAAFLRRRLSVSGLPHRWPDDTGPTTTEDGGFCQGGRHAVIVGERLRDLGVSRLVGMGDRWSDSAESQTVASSILMSGRSSTALAGNESDGPADAWLWQVIFVVMANLLSKFLDQVVNQVERAAQLDPAAERLAAATAPLFQNRQVVDLASGTPAGHPLHPLLVTIPIGFWSGALVFDGLQQAEAADTLIGLGALSALPATFTGLSDWRDTAGGERRVGLVHATLNSAALSLFTASWVARRVGRRPLGVGLALAGMGLVSVSGWLGGHLVYALGVGVDTTAFQQAPEEWTYAAAEADVQSGALTMGAVNGVPLVLTRLGSGDIVAYADRCTHRGGPLHEGDLVDGCIRCPWHGSEFSVEDGTVVRGPATRPQASFEVRVHNERVEVRRSDEVRALRSNPVGR